MKRTHKEHRIVLIAALLLAASAACVQDVSTPEESVTSAELEQALQSITSSSSFDQPTDEQAYFGDDRFRAAYEAEIAEVPDNVDQSVAMIPSHRIMALWGRIQPNAATEPQAMVWNPQILVQSRDIVRVRSTLYFDAYDAILPVDCLNCVEIRSATRPHVDGVILDLLLDESDSSAAFFEFNSLPISLRYSAAELAELNEVIILDQAGNGLMLVSMMRPEQEVQSGVLSGHWAAVDSDGTDRGPDGTAYTSEDGTVHPDGYFGGRWMSEDGGPMGFLAGRYTDGEFFGKYIGSDGRFEGHLLGEYADGYFHGEWFNRTGNLVGILHGTYTVASSGSLGRFEGVWSRLVTTDPSTGVASTTSSNPDGTDDSPSNEDGTDDSPSNEDGTDDSPGNEDGTDDSPGNEDGTDDSPSNEDGTDDSPGNEDGSSEDDSSGARPDDASTADDDE